MPSNVRQVPWTDKGKIDHLLIFSVDDTGALIGSQYTAGTGFSTAKVGDGFAPKSPVSVLVGALGQPYYIHVAGLKPDGTHHQVAYDGTKWFATL